MSQGSTSPRRRVATAALRLVLAAAVLAPCGMTSLAGCGSGSVRAPTILYSFTDWQLRSSSAPVPPAWVNRPPAPDPQSVFFVGKGTARTRAEAEQRARENARQEARSAISANVVSQADIRERLAASGAGGAFESEFRQRVSVVAQGKIVECREVDAYWEERVKSKVDALQRPISSETEFYASVLFSMPARVFDALTADVRREAGA